MSLIDEYEFKKCVDRYKGDRHAIKFNCRDQFILRDIETTLNLCGDLYRSGINMMPKSTLAEANKKKDWRIYQDFAMTLVKEATALYKDEKLRIDLEEMTYPFDSSTIELCLKLCPWAEFHHGKGAFKMHTLMDLRGSIPTFVHSFCLLLARSTMPKSWIRCSSNGSNSICILRPSTEHPRTPFTRKSG